MRRSVQRIQKTCLLFSPLPCSSLHCLLSFHSPNPITVLLRSFSWHLFLFVLLDVLVDVLFVLADVYFRGAVMTQ